MRASLTPQARQTLLEKRTRLHGDAAAAWVEGLPELVEAISEAWSLTPQPHFENLSYNYVAPVTRADGAAAVVKLSFPKDEEMLTEIAALRHFSGRGCVRLISADLELGAALMERAVPGLPLSTLRDDAAEVRATASVMRAIWRPAPGGSSFPTMATWFERAAAKAKQRPGLPGWLERALVLGLQLAGEPGPEAVLLHGDLHHDNILSSGDEWLCIDPKGVVGEPAWEAGPYLYNNLPDAAGEAAWRRTIKRRADQFADELSLDHQRVYACSAAYAALSCAWSMEEGAAAGSLGKPRAAIEALTASV